MRLLYSEIIIVTIVLTLSYCILDFRSRKHNELYSNYSNQYFFAALINSVLKTKTKVAAFGMFIVHIYVRLWVATKIILTVNFASKKANLSANSEKLVYTESTIENTRYVWPLQKKPHN